MTVSAMTNTEVDAVITDMHIQMINDVYGIPKSATLALAEKFDIETTYYFNLTIVGGTNALASTDIQISASALSGVSGTTLATALQTAIRALAPTTLTVAWTDYYFTIDAIDSTSITISGLSDDVNYVDAKDMLFGKSGTQTGTTWTGGFPEDCTWETDLPTNYHSMQHVFWDKYEVAEIPEGLAIHPQQYSSRPSCYSIRDQKIRLIPVPNVLRQFYIEYMATSTEAYFTTDTIEPDFPEQYHIGLAYKTAEELLRMNHEFREADEYEKEYRKIRNLYRSTEGNQVTAMRPPKTRPAFVEYRVDE
jgi:hypothetical protein